jgi:hypothetical protein
VKGIVEKKISSEIWNEARRDLLKNDLAKITGSEISPYDSAEKLIQHYKRDIEGMDL